MSDDYEPAIQGRAGTLFLGGVLAALAALGLVLALAGSIVGAISVWLGLVVGCGVLWFGWRKARSQRR